MARIANEEYLQQIRGYQDPRHDRRRSSSSTELMDRIEQHRRSDSSDSDSSELSSLSDSSSFVSSSLSSSSLDSRSPSPKRRSFQEKSNRCSRLKKEEKRKRYSDSQYLKKRKRESSSEGSDFTDDETRCSSPEGDSRSPPNIDFKKSKARMQFNFEHLIKKYEKVKPSGIEIDVSNGRVYAPNQMPPKAVDAQINKFQSFTTTNLGFAKFSAAKNSEDVLGKENKALAKQCQVLDEEFEAEYATRYPEVRASMMQLVRRSPRLAAIPARRKIIRENETITIIEEKVYTFEEWQELQRQKAAQQRGWEPKMNMFAADSTSATPLSKSTPSFSCSFINPDILRDAYNLAESSRRSTPRMIKGPPKMMMITAGESRAVSPVRNDSAQHLAICDKEDAMVPEPSMISSDSLRDALKLLEDHKSKAIVETRKSVDSQTQTTPRPNQEDYGRSGEINEAPPMVTTRTPTVSRNNVSPLVATKTPTVSRKIVSPAARTSTVSHKIVSPIVATRTPTVSHKIVSPMPGGTMRTPTTTIKDARPTEVQKTKEQILRIVRQTTPSTPKSEVKLNISQEETQLNLKTNNSTPKMKKENEAKAPSTSSSQKKSASTPQATSARRSGIHATPSIPKPSPSVALKRSTVKNKQSDGEVEVLKDSTSDVEKKTEETEKNTVMKTPTSCRRKTTATPKSTTTSLKKAEEAELESSTPTTRRRSSRIAPATTPVEHPTKRSSRASANGSSTPRLLESTTSSAKKRSMTTVVKNAIDEQKTSPSEKATPSQKKQKESTVTAEISTSNESNEKMEKVGGRSSTHSILSKTPVVASIMGESPAVVSHKEPTNSLTEKKDAESSVRTAPASSSSSSVIELASRSLKKEPMLEEQKVVTTESAKRRKWGSLKTEEEKRNARLEACRAFRLRKKAEAARREIERELMKEDKEKAAAEWKKNKQEAAEKLKESKRKSEAEKSKITSEKSAAEPCVDEKTREEKADSSKRRASTKPEPSTTATKAKVSFETTTAATKSKTPVATKRKSAGAENNSILDSKRSRRLSISGSCISTATSGRESNGISPNTSGFWDTSVTDYMNMLSPAEKAGEEFSVVGSKENNTSGSLMQLWLSTWKHYDEDKDPLDDMLKNHRRIYAAAKKRNYLMKTGFY